MPPLEETGAGTGLGILIARAVRQGRPLEPYFEAINHPLLHPDQPEGKPPIEMSATELVGASIEERERRKRGSAKPKEGDIQRWARAVVPILKSAKEALGDEADALRRYQVPRDRLVYLNAVESAFLFDRSAPLDLFRPEADPASIVDLMAARTREDSLQEIEPTLYVELMRAFPEWPWVPLGDEVYQRIRRGALGVTEEASDLRDRLSQGVAMDLALLLLGLAHLPGDESKRRARAALRLLDCTGDLGVLIFSGKGVEDGSSVLTLLGLLYSPRTQRVAAQAAATEKGDIARAKASEWLRAQLNSSSVADAKALGQAATQTGTLPYVRALDSGISELTDQLNALLSGSSRSQAVDVPRFWAPLGHQPQLDPSGYLAESFSFLGLVDSDGTADKGLVATTELETVQGLILLGPPGSGKSVELARLRREDAGGTPAIMVELNAIADAEDLRRQLLEHDVFETWHEGHSELTLFLDSIDEGILSVENLATILKAALRDGPGDRLRIRVTCRAADWPRGLEEGLRSLLGVNNVQKLSLAPLRAKDAIAIAEAALDGGTEAFFQAVAQAGAGSLAALPLTLQLLVEVYQHQGQLPERPVDLFEQATLHLCEEANLDRLDANRTGSYDPSVRHDLATHIAGLLRLSGKTHLDLRSGVLAPEDALTLKDLVSPPDAPEARVPLDQAAVLDLVRHSGLFESAGDRSFRFAHAALGEFLAARFLHRQGTPPTTALALLSHPDGGLLPQLRQVAAWLAALDSEFFGLLAEEDAEAALTYVADLTTSQRAALLAALMRDADRGAVDIYEVDRSILERLDYDGVSDDLRSILNDSDRSVHARRLAIVIADRLEHDELVPDLVQLALDATAPIRVRTSAVYALQRLGTQDDLTALRPLAEVPRREDPARDLAQAARHALFPETLSVRDLITFARQDAAADDQARKTGESPPPPPVEAGLSVMPGPHAQLLRHVVREEASHLSNEGLNDALRDLADTQEPDAFEQQAALALTETAADRLPDAETATALALLIVGPKGKAKRVSSRLPRVVAEVSKEIGDDAEKRHALLRAIVEAAAAQAQSHAGNEENVVDRVDLYTLGSELVKYSKDETVWLIDQLRDEEEPVARRIWFELVRRATSYADRDIWETVLTACLGDSRPPELDEIYAARYAARDITGPEADAAREAQREWDQHPGPKRIPHTPPLPTQLDRLLADEALSPFETFDRVLDLLDRDPEDVRGPGSFGYLNPTGSKLWSVLNEAQQERLISLARDVLRSATIPTEEAIWKDGRVSTQTRVVLEAIALLAPSDQFDPILIPDEALVSTTVAFLAWPYSFVNEVSEARDALRDAAWNRKREELIGVLVEVAKDPENAYTVLGHLLPKWDDRLGAAFVRSAQQHPPVSGTDSVEYERVHILDRLMVLGVDAAIDTVLEEIAPLRSPDTPLAPGNGESEADAEARLYWRSTKVFLLAPDRTWDLIGDRFDTDDDFARRWLKTMASRLHDREHEWPDVPAELTGHIYRRLHTLIPPSEDVQRPGGASYTPSAPDNVKDFRWALIGALTSRASSEDVAQVRALHTEYPDAGLERAVVNVERQHRLLYPHYPSPAEVLRTATDPTRRPVRSDAELQRAVVDALDVVQSRIAHDEQRAASVFWAPAGNTKADGLRPRDENYVSDRIAGMLRDILEPQGIVVTRESEGNRYDRTDILVQAPPDQARGRSALASVTIEVKGSWHPDVLTAMSSQLIDRYLAGTGRQHGVFLVVWFDPTDWSEEDARRKHESEKHNPEDLQAALLEQASSAAENDYTVVPIVLRVPSGW